MHDMLLSESRKLRPLPLVAWSATGILSLAILANAFFGQPVDDRSYLASSDNTLSTSDGAATRVVVDADGQPANTIQLKYDPMVESVQRELLAAGFYKGLVDGVLGRKTRQAIQDYQESSGLDVDGKPSAELAEHVRFTREVSEASLFTGSIEPDPDAEARAVVRRAQTGLAELAYNPGQINGELTSQTRKAIQAFQRDRQMPETGDISDELLAELRKMSGQSELMPD